MSVIALAAALLVALGAMAALRVTDARLAALGTTLCLLAAPLVADPLPDPLVLALRVVAALLAGYLLFLPIRRAAPLLGGLRLGGTGEAAFVGAAFVIGLLAGSVTSEAQGPVAALAGAFALLLAGLLLLAWADDGVRLGGGALFALTGVGLLVTALGGALNDPTEAAFALATVAVAGSASWLALVALGARGELRFPARHGDLHDLG